MKKICLFVYFIIMVVLCISLTSCFLFYDRGYRFASDLVDALDNKDAKYIKESFQKKVNVTDEEVNALFEAYGDEKHSKFSVNSIQSTTGNHGVVDDYYSSRLTIEKESVVFNVTYLWYRTASDGDDGLKKLIFRTEEDYNTYKYFINGYSLLSEYSKGLFVLGYNFNFNNLCIEASQMCDNFIKYLDESNIDELNNLFSKKLDNSLIDLNPILEYHAQYKGGKYWDKYLFYFVDDYYSSRLTIEKESVVFDVTYLWYRTASDGDDGLERLVFKTKEDDNTYKYFINGYSLLSEYSKGLFVLGYNFNFNNLCIETSQMCDNFIKYLDESNIDELNNLFSKKLDNSLIDLNQILEYHEQYKGWKYWHKYLFYFVDEGVEYTCWNMNIYYETIMIIYCHSENKEEAGIQYLKFVKGLISSSKYEKNEVKVGFSIDEEGEKTYFS